MLKLLQCFQMMRQWLYLWIWGDGNFIFIGKYFFPLYFAQLVSIFGINLSAFGENPVMGYWRGTDLRVSHSNPVKAPIYPLIHDISGVFVSKLLDTQQKPHQGIKNKTQTWIL